MREELDFTNVRIPDDDMPEWIEVLRKGVRIA